MKSSTLVAHVPIPVAKRIKEKAMARGISVSRYITRLLENDAECESVHSPEALEMECKGAMECSKSYDSTDEFLRDLREEAARRNIRSTNCVESSKLSDEASRDLELGKKIYKKNEDLFLLMAND
jgi:hypothetical protein